MSLVGAAFWRAARSFGSGLGARRKRRRRSGSLTAFAQELGEARRGAQDVLAHHRLGMLGVAGPDRLDDLVLALGRVGGLGVGRVGRIALAGASGASGGGLVTLLER